MSVCSSNTTQGIPAGGQNWLQIAHLQPWEWKGCFTMENMNVLSQEETYIMIWTKHLAIRCVLPHCSTNNTQPVPGPVGRFHLLLTISISILKRKQTWDISSLISSFLYTKYHCPFICSLFICHSVLITLTAVLRPWRSGVFNMRASNTSSDSLRTYNKTERDKAQRWIRALQSMFSEWCGLM